MIVWRISRPPYAANPLSGEGAARFANRWNSKGVRMGYASTSRSLAVLEMLMHVTRDTSPANTLLIPIEVPDKLIAELIDPPPGWSETPFREASQAAGDHWIREMKSAAFLVPSAVLPAERNLLINPRHPDFPKIRIRPYEAPRLFQP